MLNFYKEIKRKIYKNPRPALFDLDRKLEKHLDFNNGFFIEVGGNDGYSQSNTYFLEKTKGWSGILIEGIPSLYKKCKKERKNSQVYNYALVSDDYPDSTIKMHYANLMSITDGSMKSSEEEAQHIQTGLECQNIKKSYTIEVPVRTLESILDETSELPKIDFFSLDVEGAELEVLKGLNIKKHKPTYILIEARFFDEVNEFLIREYDLIEKLTIHDYLYRLKKSK